MQDTAREVRTNWYMTFSYRPLHMNVPVLADQQELTNNCTVRAQNVVWSTCQEQWIIGEKFREICASSKTSWWWLYEMPSISFQTFFVQAFKIVIDSWKFSMLLLYILWDDRPILMISALNKQLQQQLEYTLLKPDCHSWWISKMQSGHDDTLKERYAIKFCFKLGKMPQKHMECFRLLFDHLAWIKHEFLSGIRNSRKAGSLWRMMRGVGGVRKSIHQSWLAKGLRLLCWDFKGVQEEIPSEEASTLQIGSVAFPLKQCTSPQLHPCHRLFDKDGHQDSSLASL